MKVDNAIIMAAGASSRFAPLSYEKHKALTVVKGEVLIERQIEQLMDAGVPKIYIVTGYKSEQFEYLQNKYNVTLLHNAEYASRNNNGSIWVAKDVISNSYICSADNYFSKNPFSDEEEGAYYAAEYTGSHTQEWCMKEDTDGFVSEVRIGGENAWYMIGHSFWDDGFSSRFKSILERDYDLPETSGKLWESIYINNLDILKMKIKKYEPGVIHEFDTLDELREFDHSYIADSRSGILKEIASELGCAEQELHSFRAMKGNTAEAIGFGFDCGDGQYTYLYDKGELSRNE